uniref:Uncharacterized protein n=1 Tax=Leptocylindrus danicus TaxID=163516 RepID=A0A7S2KE72_9STRA|mmetsp:Transcript_21020/g.31363  ORF Transcript_21020/g.31363 Transcript_21020/m.31363 type:complete len:143 (+) Transcript_21020:107-535(+)|eukprot:CAMPEP_0116030680 /NCGR_PEP_ID=MMETSP0321-20121206/17008_1 /TAXON_ID=163516 /ORGANISM="Leptocylindrus danicus var. danicus, Strain B650" /LENGTH=142 /DNA_ID=CAMNT_0003505551 /DNA_START=84 /DNA_END=512 /DNA_ORIENTATION=+
MKTTAALFAAFTATASAFAPVNRPAFTSKLGVTIADGVEFDTVAREWRCKWSPDDEKASLVAAQKALEEVVGDIKGVEGVKDVSRVVCGGCLDFKVVTSLSAEDFGKWEEKGFVPEEAFLDKLKAIDGISVVETQTYTLMPV